MINRAKPRRGIDGRKVGLIDRQIDERGGGGKKIDHDGKERRVGTRADSHLFTIIFSFGKEFNTLIVPLNA